MPRQSVAVLLLSTLTFCAMAGPGEESLRAFLNDLQSLQTEFTQQLFNENGDLLDTASGTLYLQRPGKFNWQYREPYEQQILTDGRTLWIYDKDLEQVTIRDVQAGLRNTPAAILGGTADIDDLYEIIDMGDVEGYHWVRLRSLDDESQYNDVRLGFDGDRLGMMVMFDNLGQTTRIDFESSELNTSIAPDVFSFTPPANVDIIDDR
jgi:outer membrane lipoprotein carrier protein